MVAHSSEASSLKPIRPDLNHGSPKSSCGEPRRPKGSGGRKGPPWSGRTGPDGARWRVKNSTCTEARRESGLRGTKMGNHLRWVLSRTAAKQGSGNTGDEAGWLKTE